MFRRATALLLAVITMAMNVEVGFGLARDGDVHHESEALAAIHADARVGPVASHGHEDLATPRATRSASDLESDRAEVHADHEDHEHGTCLDHCTHVHAPAVPGHAPPALPVMLTAEPPLVHGEHFDHTPFRAFYRPPKA